MPDSLRAPWWQITTSGPDDRGASGGIVVCAWHAALYKLLHPEFPARPYPHNNTDGVCYQCRVNYENGRRYEVWKQRDDILLEAVNALTISELEWLGTALSSSMEISSARGMLLNLLRGPGR